MNIKQRLDTLPPMVVTALQPNFIFLIDAQKIQHFPIREWSKEQVIAEITTRLEPDFLSDSWHHFLVCWNAEATLLLIIPRFTTISELPLN